jgi:hypothetical protein
MNETSDSEAYSSPLEHRRKLYPGLYKTDEEAQAAIEKYAVELPDTYKRPRLDSAWQRLANSANTADDDALVPKDDDAAADHGTSLQPKATQLIYSNADIWGAIPPKEPKYMVECQICNRQVAASRFAPHLDKCMGLGTLRGAVTSNVARTSALGNR